MSRNNLLGWAFVFPAVILITAFLIYPTIRTIQLSFDTGLGFTTSEYVGLENYSNLFTRDRFFFDIDQFPPRGAVFNTIIWLGLFTAGTVGIGLVVAVLANAVRYEVLIKTIIFIPMAISFTAAGIIWRFVYSPDEKTGILNAILVGLIPSTDPIPWLGRIDIVNVALIIAGIWIWTGFCMVILSAALKGLPQEVMEAARVDGANSWQTFWRITIPMLLPTISVITTTMIINVLKAFDIVYIMTAGGPRGASRIIGFTMYWETFQNGKPGYGAAVAVIMLLLMLPFVIINIRRYRSGEQGT
ncbi:MAG: sugar ABC transporter permease [Chloroflexi bacterium]|uniref:carbohydrate ABC transporter permease n=1 Tax=Candidatus Flexifilum breve TaxID=3140694 RepID=UPI0031376D14|nr:sugar ABC transporter permease [Chloroflexota bacterium]